jgi:hypothetical protein
MTTNCNVGAATVKTGYIKNSQQVPLAKIELRYSPTCKTNWSRLTSVNSTTRTMQAGVFRYSDNVTLVGGIATAHVVWSAMAYAPGVCADARGLVFFSNGTKTGGQTAKACG